MRKRHNNLYQILDSKLLGKNLLKILLFFFFLDAQICSGQNFSRAGGPIADNGNFVDFPLEVSGISQPIDANFGLYRVCLSIDHRHVDQLNVELLSPAGIAVNLFNGIGWDGDNFINTCFSGWNNPLIFNASPPFTGIFRPMQSLGLQNNGQVANGIWKLRIRDARTPTSGTLQFWSISFSSQPATLFPFSSSNMPVVLLDTRSQLIPDEPKIFARMKILNIDASGRAILQDSSQSDWMKGAIEQRGSSSASFPKKSYGFEFQDALGEDTSRAVLGMPPQSDWVLSANYTDKSLMRNVFAYNLSRSFGWYAPRTRYVELMLNGEYQGIYVFTEKIKRDQNRVDIARLRTNDVSGDDVTGGYIIKIDKPTGNDSEGFSSNYAGERGSGGQRIKFLYDYPKASNLVIPQKNYIKAYMDSFENALNTMSFQGQSSYKKYINMPSFIDFFLVNEWSKNIDGFRFSTFITKQKITRDQGKLIMGPVWDFDIAWRNANYCDAQFIPGWTYQVENVCPSGLTPTWWRRFRTDPEFEAALVCRWLHVNNEIWPPLKRAEWVDSVSQLLQEAQVRNFTFWPILGQYVWPNPDPILSTYVAEVAGFQNWLNQRANWMSANLQGICINSIEKSEVESELKVFPNPASELLRVEGFSPMIKNEIKIFDAMGRSVEWRWASEKNIELKHMKSGVYLLYLPGQKAVMFVKQ